MLSGDSGAPNTMRSRQAAPRCYRNNSGESTLWSCKSWWAAIQSNTPPETPSGRWLKCQTWTSLSNCIVITQYLWLALAKQIWRKLQGCWGLTCAALASAGIQTLYCVRNSTCGTAAASTRKAWSINEFLLALTNKNEEFESNPNWLILDSNDTGLNFSMTDINARFDDFDASCSLHPREIWVFAAAFNREQSWTFTVYNLDFHRCEMPFRPIASDWFL